MLLLMAFLASAHPTLAASCSEMTLARVEAARVLIQDVETAPEIDRASVAERAVILLDRALKAEPACSEAKSLRREAARLVKKTTPISEAADLDEAITDATRRIEAQETAQDKDPEEIEAVRFMVADLLNRFPDDQRLSELAHRASALRGE